MNGTQNKGNYKTFFLWVQFMRIGRTFSPVCVPPDRLPGVRLRCVLTGRGTIVNMGSIPIGVKIEGGTLL
jgi:hypothetical protein